MHLGNLGFARHSAVNVFFFFASSSCSFLSFQCAVVKLVCNKHGIIYSLQAGKQASMTNATFLTQPSLLVCACVPYPVIESGCISWTEWLFVSLPCISLSLSLFPSLSFFLSSLFWCGFAPKKKEYKKGRSGVRVPSQNQLFLFSIYISF